MWSRPRWGPRPIPVEWGAHPRAILGAMLFDLSILAVALVAAAVGTGAHSTLRDQRLASTIASCLGMRAMGRVALGTLSGHRVRVVCGRVTHLTIIPKRHHGEHVQFRPRSLGGLLEHFDLGNHEPVIGDALLDHRYVFKGEPVDLAAFATEDIRRRLIQVECEWKGSSLRAQHEGRNARLLESQIVGLVELAEAMAQPAPPVPERLQQIALVDHDVFVRAHVLALLAQHFGAVGRETALKALDDPTPAVRFVAMYHLPNDAYPPPAEAELLEVAQSFGPYNARRAAIHLLRQYGSTESARALNALRTDRALKRAVEQTMAALQARSRVSAGRVSLVGDSPAGQVSEVGPKADRTSVAPESVDSPTPRDSD